MPRRLGRLVPDRSRLVSLPQFAAVAPQLPDPPAAVNYGTPQGYAGTLGNETAGDCTVAGLLRLQQNWAALQGQTLAFTDDQALAIYSQLTGYDPSTGQPDPGMDETVVLDDWASAGFMGNQLSAYCSVDPSNLTHVKQSIQTFGGVYLGLMLPRSAMEQTDAGQPWRVALLGRGILGGHCVVSFEYDESYLYVGTWGERQPVEWSFVERYFDAAYGVLDPLWIGADGLSPSGLDLSALTADLPAVAN